ncbi:thioredoxin domain-containing protein 5 homolog [Halyomorpha halys]|uniref:thioredoxin domain-containing protein 5 homolog n=1 Tax=Halyomorpha halys TaxID=286706 RepID=UPI0006D4F629|nr:thioredoxin domain-containing protein 5 homolog [Halyomorpha halys]
MYSKKLTFSCSYLLRIFFLVSLKSVITFCQEEPKAVELDSTTFSKEIGTSNFFIMFFAPWCPHCHKLKDTWEELAEMLNEPGSRVTIGKVDCTKEGTLCTQQQITGYPTLMYYKKGEVTPSKYSGTRDLSSFANYLNEQLGTNIVEQGIGEVRPSGPVDLTDETYSDHLSKGKHFVKFYAPWCGHCQSLSPTWENVGITFAPHESVTIGKVDCTVHKEACRTYDIKSYPTLLWIEDGQKIEKYQGPRTTDELEAFVLKRLSDTAEKVPLEASLEEPPSIVALSGTSFKEDIAKGFTFVKYFAPWCGHCKRLAPTWQDLGNKFEAEDKVQIAEVDCTREDNRQLCDDQEIGGFPTLVLYKSGKKVDKYSGSRALMDLYDFVMKHVDQGHDEL